MNDLGFSFFELNFDSKTILDSGSGQRDALKGSGVSCDYYNEDKFLFIFKLVYMFLNRSIFEFQIYGTLYNKLN